MTLFLSRPGSCARLAAGGLALAALVGLSACGEGGAAGALRSAGFVGGTPDEFMVLPTRPLEVPNDLNVLPPPTLGGPNRVDVQPQVEAVTALTGRPPGEGASGAALVARVGPADPNIRATVAAENAEFAQSNGGRLFERWFGNNPRGVAYRSQTLDASAEYLRLRALGVGVPAAPVGAVAGN
jgi:hypothetical protein